MCAVASIVSGVRLAGLDGLILLLTFAVGVSAWILSRPACVEAVPPIATPAPSPATTGRPEIRSAPERPWLPAALILAATLIAMAAGQLSFKPNWLAEPALACALGGLLLALAVDGFAHVFGLAGQWRSALRIAAGALLIVAGQLAGTRTTTVLAHFRSGEHASRFFKLDVPNADNVFFALLLFALGIAFVARGVFSFDALNRPALADSPAEPAPTKHSRAPRDALALAAVLLALPLFELHRGRYRDWELAAWLGSLALLSAGTWLMDRRNGVRVSLGFDRLDLVLVVVVLAAGGAIGLHRLAAVPNSLMGDEGQFWETAAAIARGQFHPHIFDPGVYTFPMLSSYV